MNAFGAILRGLVGLFIDDGALALVTVIWVVCVGWLLPVIFGPVACALLLFLGLLGALTFCVLRA